MTVVVDCRYRGKKSWWVERGKIETVKNRRILDKRKEFLVKLQ